jgi:hypothetical protein
MEASSWVIADLSELIAVGEAFAFCWATVTASPWIVMVDWSLAIWFWSVVTFVPSVVIDCVSTEHDVAGVVNVTPLPAALPTEFVATT